MYLLWKKTILHLHGEQKGSVNISVMCIQVFNLFKNFNGLEDKEEFQCLQVGITMFND